MYYIRESDDTVTPPFLSDGAYAEARQAIPFVATDAVIFDPDKRVIYLAWRQITPAQGWWVIGGGVKNGQRPADAMAKSFMRETTLGLPPERFRLLDSAINFTQWTRQERISNVHIPYAVQLSASELATVRAGLDAKEYQNPQGLRAFVLDDLLQAIDEGTGYPQPVLYYDVLFGTNAFADALARWQTTAQAQA